MPDPGLLARFRASLAGSYDVERELPGGGMSRVFVATDTRLGRQVVIKVLAPELAAGISTERFAREVRLAAQLQQANIVPVFATGELDDLPYYTMPWVEGESLRTRMTSAGALPVGEVIRTMRDVTRALAYAHSHGVVHRDIKPENVLLSGGAAVVTDFGIAKAIGASRTLAPFETLTQVGTSLGTPAYMAPEQAVGDPATDHRADIYALGVTAYEMLAGARPFAGTSLHELVKAHMTQAPPPLEDRRADVPEALAELVMRCLAKDPADRPQSADDILRALDEVVVTPTGTAPGHRRRGLRKSAVRRAAFAAVAIVVMAGGYAAWRTAGADAPVLDPTRVLARPIAVEGGDAGLARVAGLVDAALERGLSEFSFMQVVGAEEAAAGSGGASDATSHAMARRAAAGTTLTGRITTAGSDSASVQWRLLDSETRRVVRVLPPVRVSRGASEEEILEALEPTLATVSIAAHPSLGAAALPLGDPPAFAALRELFGALNTVDQPGTAARLEAMRQFDRAASLDTAFLQARLWWAYVQAQTFWPLYYPDSVASRGRQLARIRASRQRLSPFETGMLDLIDAWEAGDKGQAIAAIRRVAEVAPDSRIGRNLVNALLDANRPREALRAVEQSRSLRLPSGKLVPLSENPERWRVRAEIQHYLGDYRAELAAARQFHRLRPDALASLRPLLRAHAALGDSARIEELLARGATMRADSLTTNFLGDILLATGQELQAHGSEAFGLTVIRRALAWFDSQPAEAMDMATRSRHILALHTLRMAREAREKLQPLLLRPEPTSAWIGLAGRIAASTGDTAEARRRSAELAAMNPHGRNGYHTLERAFIAANLGRNDEAIQLLQQSIAEGVGFTIRSRLHFFGDVAALRGYPPFERIITPDG